MEYAVEFVKNMASIGIFCIIISKFYHCKKPSLVVLLIVDKDPEVDFYSIVLPFCLTIYLGVQYYKESLLNTQKIIVL